MGNKQLLEEKIGEVLNRMYDRGKGEVLPRFQCHHALNLFLIAQRKDTQSMYMRSQGEVLLHFSVTILYSLFNIEQERLTLHLQHIGANE